MPAISYPDHSSPGERPGEGQGRLVNVGWRQEGDTPTLRPLPGLTSFTTTLANPRGFLVVGNTLYQAVGNKIYAIDTSGTVSALTGTIDGVGPVTMARNNATTPIVVIVTDSTAYYITGGGVAAYPDLDVGSPNSVCSFDNYFFFTYGDGTIRASNLGVTDIATTSNAKAESNPDGLLRCIPKGSQVVLLGPNSTEWWYDAAKTPFPLERSETRSIGTFGRWSVTGFEDGWDRPLFTVSADGRVLAWGGYDGTRVSTADVERSIAAVETPESLQMCCYVANGRAAVVLSGPDFTWELDADTGRWSERESYGQSRWRGKTSVYFTPFRRWLVGDTLSADVLTVSPEARTERGEPLVCTAEGYMQSRATLSNIRFAFSTGQGREGAASITERDPQVMIDWSINGAASFGNALHRSLGRQGQYRREIRVNSLGAAKDRPVALRWRVSDPVDFAFLGAGVGRVEALR